MVQTCDNTCSKHTHTHTHRMFRILSKSIRSHMTHLTIKPPTVLLLHSTQISKSLSLSLSLSTPQPQPQPQPQQHRHSLSHLNTASLSTQTQTQTRTPPHISGSLIQGDKDGKLSVEIKIGDEAHLIRSYSSDDVIQFGELSGDCNPVHIDERAASHSRFGQRVVHGILTSSLFSTIFGMRIPGCIYLNQTLKFTAPVYLNESIRATVKVTDIRQSRRIVTCETTAIKEHDGTLVITGNAQVLIPNLHIQTE
jgi:acyl dehydratase